jgi:hypothetical protein
MYATFESIKVKNGDNKYRLIHGLFHIAIVTSTRP